MAPSEDGLGFYVYAIVRDDPDRPLDDFPTTGIDLKYPVYTLLHRDLRVVVSRVDLREFGQDQLEAHMADMHWVKNKAYAHQSVLQAVMNYRTPVPMRFCTIYRSEDSLHKMVDSYYEDFAAALAELDGCQEWGVKVFFDSKLLVAEAERLSGKVQAFKVDMDGRSEGAAYFQRKKLESLVDDEAEAMSIRYAQDIYEHLSGLAQKSVTSTLQTRETAGRPEPMALNASFLVGKDRWAVFQNALDGLQTQYGAVGGIIEVSGPWPPYNFVNIGNPEGDEDDAVAGN